MREHVQDNRSWPAALVMATAVMLGAYLGLALIPDLLISFLTSRVSPDARDLIVTGYFVVAFLALSWAFVAAQRWRRD